MTDPVSSAGQVGDGGPVGRSFVLRLTPTVEDYEAVLAARRRATRAVWLDRGMGVVYLVLGLVMLLGTAWDLGGAPWLLLGAVLLVLGFGFLTGRTGRWYRRLFTWRSNPGMFVPVEETVDDDGISTVSDDRVQQFAWSHWTSVLELPEHVVVATSPRGNASINVLARRGLEEPERWDELVRFVRERVGTRS